METRDLLLEIGVEEMPAQFMPGALKQLGDVAAEGLKDARLQYSDLSTYGTPRRITLYVFGLAASQEDLAVKSRGPSVKVAFDADGNPTKALQGFARGQGVDIDEVVQEEVKGVPYVFAHRVEKGQLATEVLPGLMDKWIHALSFPKPMRWGRGEMRFARPIRWLVAMYGSQVLPLEVGRIQAGNITRGHRFLHPESVQLEEPGQYLAKLQEAWVIADQDRRRQMILDQVQDLAAQHGGMVPEDDKLLTEVSYLVEYPTALYGEIPEEYMDIPAEVLVTSMKEHQRYFPVVKEDGILLPGFIAVRNGSEQHLDVVRVGNEKVLRARLDDAAFFWTEDQKTSLADQRHKLAKVVFMENLGSIGDRVERLEALTLCLADQLGVGAQEKEQAHRAAALAKSDLVTQMVNEFPELQGIMGEKYANLGGEAPQVGQAIREHYLPRHAGDALPQSAPGTLVALADKIDVIIGCFAQGLIPTGSQDPYALRRQAQAICLIAMEGDLPLSLAALAQESYKLYQDKFSLQRSWTEVWQDVAGFFQQRLSFLLKEAGTRYDVVDAVLAAGIDQPTEVQKRALALTNFRGQADFAALLTAYTRAANLARKGEGHSVNPQHFQDPAEGRLWEGVQEARNKIAAAPGDYAAALQTLADLRPVIDAFFDAAMVMAEDEAVRRTRLALLQAVVDLMEGIADLSKIVE